MKDSQSVTIKFTNENAKFRENQKLPSITNKTKENFQNDEKIEEEEKKTQKNTKCPCSNTQLLIIVIPTVVVVLFLAIFLPIYLTNKDDEDEFDEFEEKIANYSYATLTPKNGYNNIYIHLGGISEEANLYLDFFKSKSTYVPKKTKLYFLTGEARLMKYMEQYEVNYPVPGWFNVDSSGNLISSEVDKFAEAKESLKYILNKIDQIKSEENIDYSKIYLGGFSQGGIMTNYVLLNSRHKLGGYMAFSGYIFDHRLSANEVIETLSADQKSLIESKKDYHILATHSFNDRNVPYFPSLTAYYTYFKEYTDFKLYSFGNLPHIFPTQPIHPAVRLWLKTSMGK